MFHQYGKPLSMREMPSMQLKGAMENEILSESDEKMHLTFTIGVGSVTLPSELYMFGPMHIPKITKGYRNLLEVLATIMNRCK